MSTLDDQWAFLTHWVPNGALLSATLCSHPTELSGFGSESWDATFSDHSVSCSAPPSFLCIIFLYLLKRDIHNLCSFQLVVYFMSSVWATKRSWEVGGQRRSLPCPLLSLWPLAFHLPRVDSQWITGQQNDLGTSSESDVFCASSSGPHNSPVTNPTLPRAERASQHIVLTSGHLAEKRAGPEKNCDKNEDSGKWVFQAWFKVLRMLSLEGKDDWMELWQLFAR